MNNSEIFKEGLVEEQYFIPYHIYETYVARRQEIKAARDDGEDLPLGAHGKATWGYPRNRPPVLGDFSTHTMSPSYEESIQEFKHWAVMNSTHLREMPTIVKPCWRVEIGWANCSRAMTCELDRSLNNILAEEAVNAATRKVVTPAIMLPASKEYSGKAAYFQGVDFFAIVSTDIESLKETLAKSLPIAIGVDIFVQYEIIPDKNGKPKKIITFDYWQNKAYLKSIDYIIDTKHLPSDAEIDCGHAVCLCGYDDSKGAFRFKNSWGSTWGEQGYAWITYDYIKNHSGKYGATYVTKN